MCGGGIGGMDPTELDLEEDDAEFEAACKRLAAVDGYCLTSPVLSLFWVL